MIPMEAGVIGEDDILADFYDLPAARFARPPRTKSPSSRTAAARIWT
jgi:hypothetical protein